MPKITSVLGVYGGKELVFNGRSHGISEIRLASLGSASFCGNGCDGKTLDERSAR
jgi:hypothetical protein